MSTIRYIAAITVMALLCVPLLAIGFFIRGFGMIFIQLARVIANFVSIDIVPGGEIE